MELLVDGAIDALDDIFFGVLFISMLSVNLAGAFSAIDADGDGWAVEALLDLK